MLVRPMFGYENTSRETILPKTDPSLFDVAGKAALIIGGGSGLGQFMTTALAEVGRLSILLAAVKTGCVIRLPIVGRLAAATAIGRNGALGDLLGPLLFLTSDASGCVTGQTIGVDGGFTAK